MKIVASLIFMTFLHEACFSQLKIHSMNELDSLQKIESRIALIFINTNWCVYCEGMKNTTFKNAELIHLLNDQYWFISLDAESKESIMFQGKSYQFSPTGANTGIHELAVELGIFNNSITFPTTTFLDEKNKVIVKWPDFRTATEFLKVLGQD